MKISLTIVVIFVQPEIQCFTDWRACIKTEATVGASGVECRNKQAVGWSKL